MRHPAVVLGLAAVLSAVMLGQETNYSAPGRLIDVGGRKLHINCTGTGSPTVVLEGGGGAFGIDWALVQPRVAESTRVCSYDRRDWGGATPGQPMRRSNRSCPTFMVCWIGRARTDRTSSS
jgi:pimeloyl-ACP methyl ester carboxylesterase